MKKLLFSLFVAAAACGCTTVGRSPFGGSVVLANPRNVYRLAENTVLKVLVQDPGTGEWKESEKKVLVPLGYYIGSGISD